MPMPAVPRSWRGPLSEFIATFIKPNLPAPDRLTAWSEWIVEGVRTSKVVVARHYGSLSRGVPTVIAGLQVLPSDLSPVWAIQQAILHGDPPPTQSFDEWAASLPLEHNQARKRHLDLVNLAGFHTAHLVDVASYRTSITARDDAQALRQTCLVEIHPMNVFWIPKPRWFFWGGSDTVKAHFACLFRNHTPTAWKAFVASVGRGAGLLPAPDPNLEYSYKEDEWHSRTRTYEVLRTTTSRSTPQIRQLAALLGACQGKQLAESAVRRILEAGKTSGILKTRQDVMRIFFYYLKQLRDDGVLK
jgi:hypothetical protein